MALSWAGLAASSACVCVGPPLLASTPRRGSVPGWSVSSLSWQVLAFSTLPPREVKVPAQFPPVGLFETIGFARKTEPSPTRLPPQLLMPPPDGALLSAAVLLLIVNRDETRNPPPNWPARLPETVVFSTVASPSPSVKPP